MELPRHDILIKDSTWWGISSYRNFVSKYNNKVLVYSHLHVFSVFKAIDKTHPKQWWRSFRPKRETVAALTLYECHALFNIRIQRAPRAESWSSTRSLNVSLPDVPPQLLFISILSCRPRLAITATASRINGCGINYKHEHAQTYSR